MRDLITAKIRQHGADLDKVQEQLLRIRQQAAEAEAQTERLKGAVQALNDVLAAMADDGSPVPVRIVSTTPGDVVEIGSSAVAEPVH